MKIKGKYVEGWHLGGHADRGKTLKNMATPFIFSHIVLGILFLCLIRCSLDSTWNSVSIDAGFMPQQTKALSQIRLFIFFVDVFCLSSFCPEVRPCSTHVCSFYIGQYGWQTAVWREPRIFCVAVSVYVRPLLLPVTDRVKKSYIKIKCSHCRH